MTEIKCVTQQDKPTYELHFTSTLSALLTFALHMHFYAANQAKHKTKSRPQY